MVLTRHFLSLAAVAALTCGLGSGPSGDFAFAENSVGSANRITAVYRVDLAGFNLGNFRLTTQFRGEDYEMRGEGKFSVLQGLIFDWRGITASKGRFGGSGPEPAMYSLNFQGGDKSQKLRMTFNGGAVTEISRVPKKRYNPHVIPTTKEQLEGVLDPMSAAFLYARSGNPNGDPRVCEQTVPVFDGTSEDGPQDTNSVIIGMLRADPAVGFAALRDLPSWRVRIAFFEPGGASQPDYEVGIRYFENGVADELKMDFGEFAVAGNLAEFERLPGGCN